MSSTCLLLAEIRLDGGSLSGVVTDETGARRAFRGWLELIAAVQAAEVEAPEREAAQARLPEGP